MELAAFHWALGGLPAAMAGQGEIAFGPEPWLLFPLGRIQIFLPVGGKVEVRLRILQGPWFLWLDLPPPRLSLGRAPSEALVAVTLGQQGINLAWEIVASHWLSLFGSLGSELGCGFRARLGRGWGEILVRNGDISLWCGLSFSL